MTYNFDPDAGEDRRRSLARREAEKSTTPASARNSRSSIAGTRTW
jgi:hypothetical protein